MTFKRFICTLAFFSSITLGCQKGVSSDILDETPIQPVSKLAQLNKVVSSNGKDSNYVRFQYNSNNQLIEYVQGPFGADSVSRSVRHVIDRNGEGIIIRLTDIMANLNGFDYFPYLTFEYKSGRYVNRVLKYSESGSPSTDSTAYVYDEMGRIIKELNYNQRLRTPTFYTGHVDYKYEGKNLVSQTYIGWDPVAQKDDTTAVTQFSYSSHQNSLSLGNEALMFGLLSEFCSQNSLTKVNWFPRRTGNQPGYITYSSSDFNLADQPLTTTSMGSDGSSRTARYYYK